MGRPAVIRQVDLGQRSLSKIYRGSAPAVVRTVFHSLFDLFLTFFRISWSKMSSSSDLCPSCVKVSPRWSLLGSKWGGVRGGSWGQVGNPNKSKIEKKKNGSYLGYCFWLIFYWFWEALGWNFVILGAKLKAKLTRKSIIWPLVGKLAEVSKMLKKHSFF